MEEGLIQWFIWISYWIGRLYQVSGSKGWFLSYNYLYNSSAMKAPLHQKLPGRRGPSIPSTSHSGTMCNDGMLNFMSKLIWSTRVHSFLGYSLWNIILTLCLLWGHEGHYGGQKMFKTNFILWRVTNKFFIASELVKKHEHDSNEN